MFWITIIAAVRAVATSTVRTKINQPEKTHDGRHGWAALLNAIVGGTLASRCTTYFGILSWRYPTNVDLLTRPLAKQPTNPSTNHLHTTNCRHQDMSLILPSI